MTSNSNDTIGWTDVVSSGQKKTTMAKLNRESRFATAGGVAALY
jgi:hypothetical protein